MTSSTAAYRPGTSRAASIMTLLALVSACQLTPKQVPRKAVVVESEYAPYKSEGNGVITGQAFLKTRGGDVKYGAGNTVQLNPVTSYSTEWFERAVVGGEHLEPPDKRIESFHRSTVADGFGKFTFEHLPAGEYYIACPIVWEVPGWGGSLQKTGATARARVTLKDGQTANVVVTWNPTELPPKKVEPVSKSTDD